MKEEVSEFTPTVENVKSNLEQGGMALQTRSTYQTAVAVNRERNLEVVLRKCLAEAAIAGDDFYYSWSQGGKNIEGLTIGASLALARNFGNCALEVARVEEVPGAHLFYGAFIDLETGFNIVRVFRQNKDSATKKDGSKTYSDGRAQDVNFQIGTSKCMRNVALNAMPKWLTEKVLEKAKENVVAKIQNLGPEKAKAMILAKANSLKIGQDRIEAVYGKERVWDTEKIIKITSALRAVEDGFEKATELFPMVEAEKEIKAETATMVKKEAVKESVIQPKPETLGVKRPSEPEHVEGVAPKGEKAPDLTKPEMPEAFTPKKQSEQELMEEMMESIKEMSDKSEIAGWKKTYNEKLSILKPMHQNTVIGSLSEKEAELNRPAPKKDGKRYDQLVNYLANARTKKEVTSQVKVITQAENDQEITKAEREDLLEKLNQRLTELK